MQPGTGRSHPFVRGKVIGGSSAINGMAFLRGDPTVYDAWANAGNPGKPVRPDGVRAPSASAGLPGRIAAPRGLHESLAAVD